MSHGTSVYYVHFHSE
uniref:Uncharacterized protein n=1 Tax=Talaromyces marneffei PM1 TaxID=1077442 RepID=A0A093VLA9_TALMA